jgi:hypothetical protein
MQQEGRMRGVGDGFYLNPRSNISDLSPAPARYRQTRFNGIISSNTRSL